MLMMYGQNYSLLKKSSMHAGYITKRVSCLQVFLCPHVHCTATCWKACLGTELDTGNFYTAALYGFDPESDLLYSRVDIPNADLNPKSSPIGGFHARMILNLV